MCALFVVMKMMDCDSWEVFSGALLDFEFLLLYLIGCHVFLLANDWFAGAVRDGCFVDVRVGVRASALLYPRRDAFVDFRGSWAVLVSRAL